MARIRTIKPDFFRHGGLFDAERETGLPLRVAFAGLWTAADREGRFAWKPRELKLDTLPYDDCDFARVLDALWTRGHIVKYVTEAGVFGFIPSWHEHQVINNREAASSLPEPTESSIATATSTRDARVADASVTPLVHAQVEGKGRERKGKGKEGTSPPASQPALKPTALTWEAYSSAYAARYGAEPVRNATVNGQLAQFVSRIGVEDAPAVASFYLRHDNALYRNATHPVNLLLRDAEALRTQWATGRISGAVKPASFREADGARNAEFAGPAAARRPVTMNQAEVFDAAPPALG